MERGEYVVQATEVDSVSREMKKVIEVTEKYIMKQGAISYREKPFYHFVSAGYSFERENIGNYPNLILNYAYGYHHNRWVNVGLGTGVERYYSSFVDRLIIPLTLDFRGDFLQKPITPFYYGNIGWGFGIKLKGLDIQSATVPPDTPSSSFAVKENNFRGGPLFEGGLGIKRNTRSELEWTFAVFFKAQQFLSEGTSLFFDPNSQTGEMRNFSGRWYSHRLGFKLGLGF